MCKSELIQTPEAAAADETLQRFGMFNLG